MKISIAMATYNGQKYISAQLESFLRQLRQPDELVISDDGSTDNTISIVEGFKKRAPFPVFIFRNKETLGYTGNFNRALSETTGDLIFISDQDDVWYKKKLKLIEEVALKRPESVVIMNDALIADEHLQSAGVTKLEQICSAGLPISSFVMGCCIAIRQEFLKAILPIPNSYHSHDGWIVSFADGIGRRHIVDHPLQFYRRHKSNTSKDLVNRTIKITSFDRKISLVRHIARSIGQKSHMLAIDDDIRYNKMQLEAVQRTLERYDNQFRAAFVSYSEQLTKREKSLNLRLLTVKMKWPKNHFQIVRLLIDGRYRDFNGVKTALHDIVAS